MTTVFLCRHGDVENPRKVMYGHLPGFGLSAKGRAQAAAVGKYVASFNIRQVRTSPLQRAQETADLILAAQADSERMVDEDLIEAEFGKYLQGVPLTGVPYRRPLWFIHFAFPGLLRGDEGPAHMAERVGRAVERARVAAGEDAAVCVSHADPVQSFWVTWLGRGPRQLHRYPVDKGGFLELKFTGEELVSVTRHNPLVRSVPTPVPEGN